LRPREGEKYTPSATEGLGNIRRSGRGGEATKTGQVEMGKKKLSSFKTQTREHGKKQTRVLPKIKKKGKENIVFSAPRHEIA